MDLVEGVSYPVGGMNALPTAMEAAARKAGVQFVYDTRVTTTIWRGERVIELRSLDGRTWAPDAVVITLDRPAALEVLGRSPGHSQSGRQSRLTTRCTSAAPGRRSSMT
jgi:phytoene desaturase